MFQAKFTNGLPIKPIEYINCVEDYEKYDTNKPIKEECKIILLYINDVLKTSGNFLAVYLFNEEIFFDFSDKYLVFANPTEETIEFFKKGGILLTAFFYDDETIKFASQFLINPYSKNKDIE